MLRAQRLITDKEVVAMLGRPIEYLPSKDAASALAGASSLYSAAAYTIAGICTYKGEAKEDALACPTDTGAVV